MKSLAASRPAPAKRNPTAVAKAQATVGTLVATTVVLPGVVTTAVLRVVATTAVLRVVAIAVVLQGATPLPD